MYQNKTYYISYFQNPKIKIPNISRLISLLKTDLKPGHLVHAELVKRLYADGKFKITDIERKQNGFDIDIQLDNSINIQVWHGASVSTHNIAKGNIEKSGAVPTDWNKDEKKFFDKINQLPPDAPGFVICYNYHLGIVVLPEWPEKLDSNRALIEIGRTNLIEQAVLYCSDNFLHNEIAKNISSALGLTLVDSGKVFETYFLE